MSTYARVVDGKIVEVREIDDKTMADWSAARNPKGAQWQLLDEPPAKGERESLELKDDGAWEVKPLPVPAVTQLQIRAALNAAKLRDAFEAELAKADIALRDVWQFGFQVTRDDLAGLNLALSDQEIDDLFWTASKL